MLQSRSWHSPTRARTCSASVCKASMENHQCEKCRLFKPTVELRSEDELLCDTCWKSPKEHSVLNATANLFCQDLVDPQLHRELIGEEAGPQAP